MKVLTVVAIALAALVCNGEGKKNQIVRVARLDGLFGFRFGMETPEWNEAGNVTVPLKNPVKRFDNVSLAFDVKTKEVYGIDAWGRYPTGTVFNTVKTDAELLKRALNKKYGVEFVRRPENEDDRHLYAHYSEPKDDAVVYLNILKFDNGQYVLELLAWNRTLKAKNELRAVDSLAPPTIGSTFNLGDPRIRQVFKVSNVQHDAFVSGGIGFDYVNPNSKKNGEGYSIVETAATKDGVVFLTITSVRIPYNTKDEFRKALVTACREWGTTVMLYKRLTVAGGTVTELDKSAAIAFVDAKGRKFENESERAIAAWQAAKENGLPQEIEVTITEVPGKHYVHTVNIMVTKSYVSCEDMCTLR